VKILFYNGLHKNILLEDFGHGEMVQANVYLIIDNGKGMILDPGGHEVFKYLLQEIGVSIGINNLQWILSSHQDPDIVTGANVWLMTTKATALASKIWLRFITHFGIDRPAVDRIKGLDDEGAIITLGNTDMYIIPAHWLHSPGNFQVYDPVSKILYSGDLGASIGQDYVFVSNFEEHIKYMEGFHRRYIPSGKALRLWAQMVRQLDIETIAPQHEAIFKGKEMVNKFINWVSSLKIRLDLMQ
jgi:flavorubredoxin